MKKLLLIIIGILCQLSLSQYQNRPRIACPNVFEYLDTREGTVGRVTIYNIQPGTHNLQVALSQYPPTYSVSASKISTFESKKSVIARIQRGEPVTFRIDFPDRGILPRVTRITFDGVLLCADSEYPPPRSSIKLTYDLSYAESTNWNSFPVAPTQNRLTYQPQQQQQSQPQPLSTALSQFRPRITCPANLFEYIDTGAGTIGKVTIHNVKPGTHILKVGLSQTPQTNSIAASQITSYHSNEELIARLESRQPIMFRVDFPDPYILPKVTLISLDNEVLCADSEYPPPRSSVRLTYTLTFTPSSSFQYKPVTIEPKASVGYGSCANRLQYQGNDGLITINNLPPDSTNNIQVKLSHTPATRSTNAASINVDHSEKDLADRLERGLPIVFRIRFADPNVSTKLTLISVNNRIICTDSEFSPPNTSVQLTYTLTHSSGQVASIPRPPARTPPTPLPPPRPPQTRPPQCGVENVDEFTERWTFLIVNGAEVEEGRFPWLVVVQHELDGKWEPKCGGSLISPRAVLTAAHCLHDGNYNPVKVGAFLGRHNIKKDSEPFGSYIPTQAVYSHPEYRKNQYSDADIGIILLSQSVRISSRINTICLWPQQVGVDIPEGSEGTVVGWGITEHKVTSPVPKMATIPMFSQNKCRAPEYAAIVSHRTICGGRRDGSGPCNGDSGGPLMMQMNQRWTLRGIISSTLRKNGICSPKSYTVFCDVAQHMNWITGLDVL